MNRRGFLIAAAAVLAAPAVVRAGALMPVRPPPLIFLGMHETDFGYMLHAAYRDPMTGNRYGLACKSDTRFDAGARAHFQWIADQAMRVRGFRV